MDLSLTFVSIPIILFFSGILGIFLQKKTAIFKSICLIAWGISSFSLLISCLSYTQMIPLKAPPVAFDFLSDYLSSNNLFLINSFSMTGFVCLFVLTLITSIYLILDSKQGRNLCAYLILLQLSVCCSFFILLADNIFFLCAGWSMISLLSCASPTSNNKTLINFSCSLLRQFFLADLCVAFGLLVFASLRQSFEVSTIFNSSFWSYCDPTVSFENRSSYLVAGWLVMVGILIKSAQNPFKNWISQASSISTPVHAILHHGIMAHSGIFLLFKMAPYYTIYDPYSVFFILIGVINMLCMRLKSVLKDDINQILSYSTSGSIALILFIYGLNFYDIAAIALIIHFVFKFCFILLSDVIVYIMSGERALSKMGGLRKRAKLTFSLALVTAVFLLGGWLFADGGRYSEIIDNLYRSHHFPLVFIYCTCLVMSGVYITRFVIRIFEGESRAEEHVEAYIKEAPLRKLLPLGGSILLGVLLTFGLFKGFVTFPETASIGIAASQRIDIVPLIKLAVCAVILFFLFVFLFSDRCRNDALIKRLTRYYLTWMGSWRARSQERALKKIECLKKVHLGSSALQASVRKKFQNYINHGGRFNIYWLETLFQDKLERNLGVESILVIVLLISLVLYSLFFL